MNCLTVHGQGADIGFVVTKSNVYPVGTEANFGVVDNGPPMQGQPPDLLSDIFGGYPVDSTDCSRHDDPYSIDSGNIVVGP